MPSLYRRPLPPDQVAFSSTAGRALFREALEAGTMESYFALAEQFHTQSEPAFCGLGSLVMVLNALGIDPRRSWRGPWRWFSEELLDCCTPLERVKQEGLTMHEVACLARCNGSDARVTHAQDASPEALRLLLHEASRSPREPLVIASYARAELGQTGSGHFSPIGGYHPARDLVLVLDVARFKYPPHWVRLEDLFRAMLECDPVTAQTRGWLALRRNGVPSSLGYFVSCREGLGIGSALDQLVGATRDALRAQLPEALEPALRIVTAVAVASKLWTRFELRPHESAEHEAYFASIRLALRNTRAHHWAAQLVAAEYAEFAAAWLLAAPPELWAELPAEVGCALDEALDANGHPAELVQEILQLRSQIAFILEYARSPFAGRAQDAPAGCSARASGPTTASPSRVVDGAASRGLPVQ